jgi:hypothetical protein
MQLNEKREKCKKSIMLSHRFARLARFPDFTSRSISMLRRRELNGVLLDSFLV